MLSGVTPSRNVMQFSLNAQRSFAFFFIFTQKKSGKCVRAPCSCCNILSRFERWVDIRRRHFGIAPGFLFLFRQDLQASLLPLCFPAIVRGLHDGDGDVKSVSAKALVPIVELLTRDSKYDEQVTASKELKAFNVQYQGHLGGVRTGLPKKTLHCRRRYQLLYLATVTLSLFWGRFSTRPPRFMTLAHARTHACNYIEKLNTCLVHDNVLVMSLRLTSVVSDFLFLSQPLGFYCILQICSFDFFFLFCGSRCRITMN